MEISPDGAAVPRIRLADDTASAVWRAHDNAARLLGVAAALDPGAPEAGSAGPALRRVLVALGATAGDLAEVNRLLGAGVRGAVADLGVVDDDVRARFLAAAGRVS
ncbi:hypothetical protein GCM10009737_17310 [Nocardioides lentus]|uniref:Uncharacterized protein n=1 Tax=Nocardioides lentus TaxID=338077 RepID=A0ABN2PA04_9ACTN